MRNSGRLIAAVGALCLLGLTTAGATVLVDSVQLVANSAGAAEPIPPAQTFTITQSGSYTVTLTDLQLPAALSRYVRDSLLH